MVVGLLWHSMASGNLGVVALTASQIVVVREAAAKAGVAVQLKIFGWKRDGSLKTDPAFADIEYVEIGARSLLNARSDFYRHLRQCQLVLDVGEGDSYSDIYGLKRLIYLSFTKYVAGSGGRSLIMSPQTLGPFSSLIGKKIAAFGFGRVKKVFARDPLSRKWLEDNGYATKSAEAIDMAFRLPFVKTVRDPSRVRIGLNISGLLYSGGYGGGNSLGLTVDFADLSHRLIEWALSIPNSEVWLIPHVYSRDIPEEDDLSTARKLQERYPHLKCAGPFSGPSEAKTFMSGLDFFSGGRMHACIGAFSAGVPIAPLAYSRKFNGLFGSLGYPVLVDCKVQNTEEAYNSVVRAYENREQLLEVVAQANATAKRKLTPYSDALVQALSELVK